MGAVNDGSAGWACSAAVEVFISAPVFSSAKTCPTEQNKTLTMIVMKIFFIWSTPYFSQLAKIGAKSKPRLPQNGAPS